MKESRRGKELDFGISKVLDDKMTPSLTSTRSFLGTPHYMAPEQLDGSRRVSAVGDQYSLGVVIGEIGVQAAPFTMTYSALTVVPE